MIEFSEDPAGQYQLVRVSGVVTGEEVLTTYHQLLASPDFRPEQNVLLDISQVQAFQFGYEVISRIDDMLAQVDALGVGHKLAIVAPNEPAYGMARMFQNMRTGTPQRVEIFYNRDDAVRWLQSD